MRERKERLKESLLFFSNLSKHTIKEQLNFGKINIIRFLVTSEMKQKSLNLF